MSKIWPRVASSWWDWTGTVPAARRIASVKSWNQFLEIKKSLRYKIDRLFASRFKIDFLKNRVALRNEYREQKWYNLTGWTNGGTPNVSLYRKPNIDTDQTRPRMVAISMMCWKYMLSWIPTLRWSQQFIFKSKMLTRNYLLAIYRIFI